jgi:serine/threonine protein kinase
VSAEAKDFVKRLLNKDYRKRMTAVQALSKFVNFVYAIYQMSRILINSYLQCCALCSMNSYEILSVEAIDFVEGLAWVNNILL